MHTNRFPFNETLLDRVVYVGTLSAGQRSWLICRPSQHLSEALACSQTEVAGTHSTYFSPVMSGFWTTSLSLFTNINNNTKHGHKKPPSVNVLISPLNMKYPAAEKNAL